MSADRLRVALVTERRYEASAIDSQYIRNILEEDRLISEGLGAHGIATQRVDWARADVDWANFDAAVLRTTWDYFERIDEFRAWLDHVATQTRLFNPLPLCRWNFDKRYLLELSDAGVATIPTRVVNAGEPLELAARLGAAGWSRGVVKPAISGGAFKTFRVDATGAAAVEAQIADVARSQAFLLQPFMPSVVERGEVTVVVIGGQATHAVRKTAAPGDFRVQDDHGGTVHAHEATPQELDLATRAMAACPARPLYGRADMIADADGLPRLIELELIEPELWVRFHPPAAVRLADRLSRELSALNR